MKNNEKCELEIRIVDNYVKYNGNCILEIRMGDSYLFILHYFDELNYSQADTDSRKHFTVICLCFYLDKLKDC